MSTAAAGNHTKWVCFLAVGAAALREKVKEEWDRRFPLQPWNVTDPIQISKLIQTEQAACSGRLPKPSLNHMTIIKNQGADFRNWDMTSLTYMLTQTRCLDLRNTNPQLFQATEKLKDLRNEFAHLPDPFGVSDNKLRALYQDFENALIGLSLTTLPIYKQHLKSILDEPAPADFKGLKSSYFFLKMYAVVFTLLMAIYAIVKIVKTPTFRKIIAILLRMI